MTNEEANAIDLRLREASGRLEPGGRPMFDDAVKAAYTLSKTIGDPFYPMFANMLCDYMANYHPTSETIVKNLAAAEAQKVPATGEVDPVPHAEFSTTSGSKHK